MDVLGGLALLAGFLGVVYGFIWAVDALNDYCIREYAYKPIASPRVLSIAPAWVLLFVALFAEGPGNIIAASALATIVTLAVGWHMAKHTSPLIACVSLILLAVCGFFAALLILWLIGLLIAPKKENQR